MKKKGETTMNQPQGIYDARQLGRPKMFVLGAQHMFAMFGATVLVPALTGMSVSATLLFAGLGTLLFHFLTKWKVPAFLGSSFAFIGGYQAIAPMIANEDGSLSSNTEMLPYACFGVVLAGLLYVVLAALFKVFGTKAVMRYFPPIVTGPIIICIGLTLSSTAITNCRSNWAIALVAIAIVVVCNIWGKGMVKIIPILLGVVGSYGVAAVCQAAGMEVMDPAKVQALLDAPWIGLPFRFEDTLFGLFSRPNVDSGMLLTSAVTIMPLALATMVEHIGGICAISSPASGISSRTRASTAPCWATAWPPLWPPCSGPRPTPPTARTPACWPCPGSMTPGSSASPRGWPSCCPSPPSSRPWCPPCPPPPWAACPWSSTA